MRRFARITFVTWVPRWYHDAQQMMMSMLITIRAHDDVPNNSSGAKREGRGERTVALIRGCLMLYWRETELERETANSGVGSKKRGSMKACGTHGRSLHITGGWE